MALANHYKGNLQVIHMASILISQRDSASVTRIYLYCTGTQLIEHVALQALHYWYYTGTLPCRLCNSFEDRIPVDEIYGCPIFKRVALTRLQDRASIILVPLMIAIVIYSITGPRRFTGLSPGPSSSSSGPGQWSPTILYQGRRPWRRKPPIGRFYWGNQWSVSGQGS